MNKKTKKKQSKLTKLNKIIDKVISTLDSFSKATKKIHFNYDAGDRRFNRLTKGLDRASGVKHDYGILTNSEKDIRI